MIDNKFNNNNHMNKKYKAVVSVSNYDKNFKIVFGCFYDYNKIHERCIRILNKTITIKIYNITLKPCCLVDRIDRYDVEIGYRKTLNNTLSSNKKYIKQNNKLVISLFKHLIAFSISNHKDYNSTRAFQKLNNIVLE